jgi:hypothetical protein
MKASTPQLRQFDEGFGDGWLLCARPVCRCCGWFSGRCKCPMRDGGEMVAAPRDGTGDEIEDGMGRSGGFDKMVAVRIRSKWVIEMNSKRAAMRSGI